MVDPSPEITKERESELEKLSMQYGGGKGVDMTQFPSFKFEGTLLLHYFTLLDRDSYFYI